MARTKKKSGVGGTILFVILLAVIVVGVYIMITTGEDNGKLEPDVKRTETEVLLDRDMEKDYPGTIREVVKVYCRLAKCLYNEEFDEEQVEALTRQLRHLYDEELLAENEEQLHFAGIKGDIAHYQSNKMSINSYTVDRASDIQYKTTDKGETAGINMYFTINENGSFTRSYQEFILRKDADGKWRILGWRQVAESDVSE